MRSAPTILESDYADIQSHRYLGGFGNFGEESSQVFAPARKKKKKPEKHRENLAARTTVTIDRPCDAIWRKKNKEETADLTHDAIF
jgi:hypothetical protein